MFIEIDYSKEIKYGYNICGDSIMMKRIESEGRVVSVLSDGLGSGVKANVLSTLTASMALKYIASEADILSSANVIMKTLPVCSERKISYSTLTIADIDELGKTTIVEYDSPPFIFMRGLDCIDVKKEIIDVEKKIRGDEVLLISKFKVENGDRIIFFSDGVTQAGLGSVGYPIGWGEKNITLFIKSKLKKNMLISSGKLAKIITDKAKRLDGYKCGDDTTCVVYTVRKPVCSLLISGAPIDKTRDVEFKILLEEVEGKKIVCGGTTAGIIARELGEEIKLSKPNYKSNIPPEMQIKGIDLVSEGIITLNRVLELLVNREELKIEENDTVVKIVDTLMESDLITFAVGTSINNANYQNNTTLDLRKNIIIKIVDTLQNNFIKKCELKFY